MSRLLSFYGDDFTGSTDVMEALASHGMAAVLFTRVPTPAEFAPFAGCDAIGLAGTSRSQTPAWMDEHLPAIFGWLRSHDARFCHYKVCSTFDSSPEIGSIGRAIDIGLAAFAQRRVALVVGAPQLKRYTFAGHLFAGYQGKTYRIDRHPVMSVHPVTPMHESDVLQHLSLQTKAEVQLLDVHDDATQHAAGQALLALPPEALPFVVGSSGIEYALMKGMGRSRDAAFAPLPGVDRLLVVSGSVSPTTARQISHASGKGFTGIPADPLELGLGRGEDVLESARKVLQAGGSPLIFTASGPASDAGRKLETIPNGRQHVSRTLGVVARKLVQEFHLQRLVIAGGDTSSHALGELDIHALTTRLPLLDTPGSPVCRAHSTLAAFDGLAIAMKGGQVGCDDYFVRLRDGIR